MGGSPVYGLAAVPLSNGSTRCCCLAHQAIVTNQMPNGCRAARCRPVTEGHSIDHRNPERARVGRGAPSGRWETVLQSVLPSFRRSVYLACPCAGVSMCTQEAQPSVFAVSLSRRIARTSRSVAFGAESARRTYEPGALFRVCVAMLYTWRSLCASPPSSRGMILARALSESAASRFRLSPRRRWPLPLLSRASQHMPPRPPYPQRPACPQTSGR